MLDCRQHLHSVHYSESTDRPRLRHLFLAQDCTAAGGRPLQPSTLNKDCDGVAHAARGLIYRAGAAPCWIVSFQQPPTFRNELRPRCANFAAARHAAPGAPAGQGQHASTASTSGVRKPRPIPTTAPN